MHHVSRLVATALWLVVGASACGSFGSADEPVESVRADGGAPDAGGHTSIRCADLACDGGEKCCLPLAGGTPTCASRNAVCPAGFGELLCSSPSACGANEVCCVTDERNAGQTGFDISRSFCVAASSCPDQGLQRSLCDLGNAAHCPNRACKPYVDDTNDLGQNLAINPPGYATCQ